MWYTGESICRFKPYQKFQEVQIALNELYRNGKIGEQGFTAETLERRGMELVKSKSL